MQFAKMVDFVEIFLYNIKVINLHFMEIIKEWQKH